MPTTVDPSKVTCTCKDRDVIIKADYEKKEGDKDTKIHYFRRSTLPYNTDFNSLKCSVVDDHQLKIEAKLGKNQNKSIPIESSKQPQQKSVQQGSKVQQEAQKEQQKKTQKG